MRQTAPFGFRYQYLAGGVNTGSGWANWNTNGAFVTYYVQDSWAAGITPVFTYYMIRQSAPGNAQGEATGIATNLGNISTMTAYWNDLKLFFQRAGSAGGSVVLHVEPDLWGFVEQRSTSDNAATVPAKVGGTGLAELAGLPDNMAGFGQAVVRLRNTYAPNVTLAYHLSVWGTGNDIVYTNPTDATVDALSARAATFFNSLGANFDVAFSEFSDRDSGFKQYIYGDGGASWWDAGDFSRNVRFLSKFTSLTGRRIVMWQIPLGNTKMRAMNNTWDHYQDNRVEWLLDDATRGHLQEYIGAGVVAFLFGRGADGATCACDAAGDGVTNPAAINGNAGTATSRDDDGGFFRQRAAAYYATGAMALSGGTTATPTATSSPPTSTPPTVPPTATPTTAPATATPTTATPTPSTTAAWTTSATVSAASVTRGSSVTVTAKVRSSASTTALIDVEVYDPAGRKVFQKFYDNRTFVANTTQAFSPSWTVPTTAAVGTYTVKIGVFKTGWGKLFSWNNGAATFAVK